MRQGRRRYFGSSCQSDLCQRGPRLLLLDEATEGLAPQVRAGIWRVLARLKAEGQAILVVDKNIAPLLRLADRHYILDRGRTVWSGASAELAADTELQHRYLGV
jgi:branched-chain amino acid transport system ATP-binding protein